MTIQRRTITPYTFLAPALVLLGIFVLYPIIAVIWYSFTDYDIATPPILIVLSIALAIIVNRRLKGIHIFRALYFVPAISGSIAIGLAWRWIFERNGLINSVLVSM